MKRTSWIITLRARYDRILRSSLCEDRSKSSSVSYRKESFIAQTKRELL
jgi:hypothetical protein